MEAARPAGGDCSHLRWGLLGATTGLHIMLAALSLTYLAGLLPAACPLGSMPPQVQPIPVSLAELELGGNLLAPGTAPSLADEFADSWVSESLRSGLDKATLSLGRGDSDLAYSEALMPAIWAQRAGEPELEAAANLLVGLAEAAQGRDAEARASLGKALPVLDDRVEAQSPLAPWVQEARLCLVRLAWDVGECERALGDWKFWRSTWSAAHTVAADDWLADALFDSGMIEDALELGAAAVESWELLDPRSESLLSSAARGRTWALPSDTAQSRIGLGAVLCLKQSSRAFAAGQADVAEMWLERGRLIAQPLPRGVDEPFLLPVRLRLAQASGNDLEWEALQLQGAAEPFAAQSNVDAGRWWRADWERSLESGVAAEVNSAAAIKSGQTVEASFTPTESLGLESTDGGRAAALSAFLTSSGEVLPAAYRTSPPSGEPAVMIPVWMRMAGFAGTAALSVLAAATFLLGRRGRRHGVAVSELVGRLDELERNRESLEREAAAMSHDLKSPVLTIRCALEMLGLDADDPEVSARIEPLNQSLDHILRLSDRSTELHLLRHGEGQGVLESIDLSLLTVRLIERWRPSAREKGVDLRLLGCKEEAPGRLPLEHAERLVDNLISNAIKYTRPGGIVEVGVEVSESGGQESGVLKPGTQKLGGKGAGPRRTAQLTVRDNGVGLPDEDLVRFFEPLARLSAQPTDGEPSTGLGTAIVAAVAQRYGFEHEVLSNAPEAGLRVLLRWDL